jgi:hypothetical protein
VTLPSNPPAPTPPTGTPPPAPTPPTPTPPPADKDITEVSIADFTGADGKYSPEVAAGKLAKAVGEIKALREFKRGVEPTMAEYEAWKKSQMTELEKAQAEAKEAREALAAQTTSAARLAAAARAGFTGADLDDAAKRLVGATAAELDADAATLFSKFGPRRPGVPDPSQGLGASGGNQATGGFAGALNAWRTSQTGQTQ